MCALRQRFLYRASVLKRGTCMCACGIGSHGDTLGVECILHETRG